MVLARPHKAAISTDTEIMGQIRQQEPLQSVMVKDTWTDIDVGELGEYLRWMSRSIVFSSERYV